MKRETITKDALTTARMCVVRNSNLADCDFLLGFVDSFAAARTAAWDRCATGAACCRCWMRWRYTVDKQTNSQIHYSLPSSNQLQCPLCKCK